jgi:acyl-homoserine-lactone acylase
MGYISAWDRFTQMEGFRLVRQGRLSELLGRATLEMDIYLRALNLNQVAQTLYLSASSDLRRLLNIYSDGVNAYLANVPLPTTLEVGRTPPTRSLVDPSTPCMYFCSNVGQSQNLQEEINLLNVAQVVAPEKLAWLFPIYPDEPLPFEEMKKLKGINLSEAAQNIEQLGVIANLTNTLLLPAAAASNNWAVSGKLTKTGSPIVANDTHLPLTMPSIWHMMHLKCPEIDGAGIAIAGFGIVAGYNRHIGIGMTMVMADNQDIFLENGNRNRDVSIFFIRING